MRKFFGIFLSAVMVLALAACGNEVTEEPTVSDDPVVVQPAEAISVTSLESEPELPAADDSSTIENSSNGNGEQYDFIVQYETIKAYYEDYLSKGLAEEGKFVSPETGMIMYSPVYAMCDINGDNFDDIIVAGELGIRSKEIAEIYYYNDGCFCTADIGGTPYGVTTEGFLVHDNDHDAESMTIYESDYVYLLGFDEAVELLACLTSTSYDQEGNESIVQTYRVDREDADEQEYFLYYTPYVTAYDEISYEELTFENLQ